MCVSGKRQSGEDAMDAAGTQGSGKVSFREAMRQALAMGGLGMMSRRERLYSCLLDQIGRAHV